jgi:hypothetical protein
MKEILKKYWWWALFSIAIVYCFAKGTPLWALITLLLVGWAVLKLVNYLESTLTDHLQGVLGIAIIIAGVSLYLTRQLVFSLIFGLLVVPFYFALKAINDRDERHFKRKYEEEKREREKLPAYRPLTYRKSVTPGGVDFPLPDHVQRAIDDEK